MPRTARDSDEDVDDKIVTRRTRASAAAPGTPVRRATRSNKLTTIDSSPEILDDNISKPVGRTTRSRAATLEKGTISLVSKNLRSRKNSAASDLSEAADVDTISKRVTRQNVSAAGTPTKTNPRSRAVRAGSEAMSTPPPAFNKRVTRASSVEPSVNITESSVGTPRRRRTRASIVPPIQLSVPEEQEDETKNYVTAENDQSQESSVDAHNSSNKSIKIIDNEEQVDVKESINKTEKLQMDISNKNEDTLTNKSHINITNETSETSMTDNNNSLHPSENIQKKLEDIETSSLNLPVINNDKSKSIDSIFNQTEKPVLLQNSTPYDEAANDDIELINVDSNDSSSSIAIIEANTPIKDSLNDSLNVDTKRPYIKLNRTDTVEKIVISKDNNYKTHNINYSNNTSQNICKSALVLVENCQKDDKSLLNPISDKKMHEIIANAVCKLNDSLNKTENNESNLIQNNNDKKCSSVTGVEKRNFNILDSSISQNKEFIKNNENCFKEIIQSPCSSLLNDNLDHKSNNELENITLVDESDTESSLIIDNIPCEITNSISCKRKTSNTSISLSDISNQHTSEINESFKINNSKVEIDHVSIENVNNSQHTNDHNFTHKEIFITQDNNESIQILDQVPSQNIFTSEKVNISSKEASESDVIESFSNSYKLHNSLTDINFLSANCSTNKIETDATNIFLSNEQLNLNQKSETVVNNLVENINYETSLKSVEIDNGERCEISVTNTHVDSNKIQNYESKADKYGVCSAVTDADGVASSPDKLEQSEETEKKSTTKPKRSLVHQKRKSEVSLTNYSDEDVENLFHDIPAEEWSNENSKDELKDSKNCLISNNSKIHDDETIKSGDETKKHDTSFKNLKSLNKSLKSNRLSDQSKDKSLVEESSESPNKSRKSTSKLNVSSEKILASPSSLKVSKRKSCTENSIDEKKEEKYEAMEVDEQDYDQDSDEQSESSTIVAGKSSNTNVNDIDALDSTIKNLKFSSKKKLRQLNKSLPVSGKNEISDKKRYSLDCRRSKDESPVNFSKTLIKNSKITTFVDTSTKKSLNKSNLSRIDLDESSNSKKKTSPGKKNILETLQRSSAQMDSPSKNIKEADEKESNYIRRSIEMMKKQFPEKHDYSTIAEAGSSSEEKNSESSSSEDEEKNDQIDSDIEKEYNLAGKEITHYEDDDIPGDDCLASEEEFSNTEDEGSDLEDFIVEDVSEDESQNEIETSENDKNSEDDEDNDVIEEEEENDQEIESDEAAENDLRKSKNQNYKKISMVKTHSSTSDSEEISENEDIKSNENNSSVNSIINDSKLIQDKSVNLSKSKNNKSANSSKIIVAEHMDSISDDENTVGVLLNKSAAKNKSMNLSQSKKNKSANSSTVIAAEASGSGSDDENTADNAQNKSAAKNKSLNLSQSKKNKSANSSTIIDVEDLDSNSDDENTANHSQNKSSAKNKSLNLSQSKKNKSTDSSKIIVVEHMDSISDDENTANHSQNKSSAKNKSLNLSQSKKNKSANSSTVVAAETSDSDSDDENTADNAQNKSAAKNKSTNLSQSKKNKSANSSTVIAAETSDSDSDDENTVDNAQNKSAAKNKSTNLSQSKKNKSANSSTVIAAETSDSDSDDENTVDNAQNKSAAKNKSMNLSQSKKNKSANSSTVVAAETSDSDSDDENTANYSQIKSSAKNKSLNLSMSINNKSKNDSKSVLSNSKSRNSINTQKINNVSFKSYNDETVSLNPAIFENTSSSDSEIENGEDSYRIITADQLNNSKPGKNKLLNCSTPKVSSAKSSSKIEKSFADRKNLSVIHDTSHSSKRMSGSLDDLTDPISQRQSLSEITATVSNRENSKLLNGSVKFNDTVEIIDPSSSPLKHRQLWKLIPLNTTVQPMGSETPGTKFLKKSKLNESVPILKSNEVSPATKKSKKGTKNGSISKKLDESEDILIDKNSKKRKLQETSSLELFENEDSVILNSKKKKKRARVESSPEKTSDQVIELENVSGSKKKKKKKDNKSIEIESFDNTKDAENHSTETKKSKETLTDSLMSSNQNEPKKKKKKNKHPSIEDCPQNNQNEDSIIEVKMTKKKSKKLQSTSQSEENTSTETIRPKKQMSISNKLDLSEIKSGKKRTEVSIDSDSDAPEVVGFEEARIAAVKAAQQAIENSKAQKKARKKKHQDHVDRMLEQKELSKQKKGVKRLSDEFLQQLPDEPSTRPVKRQKLSKGKERLIMPSTSMFSPGKRTPKNLDVEEGYLPLSSAGSTTQFGIVNLQKTKALPKKNIAALNFREKMLARNARQPVSAHFAYLEKQKAKGENRHK